MNLYKNLFDYRCVPDKHAESCYYLDSAAIQEKSLSQEQKQMLVHISEVLNGRIDQW